MITKTQIAKPTAIDITTQNSIKDVLSSPLIAPSAAAQPFLALNLISFSLVGDALGALLIVGDTDGANDRVGDKLGGSDGRSVGKFVGDTEGCCVGDIEGLMDGKSLG